MRKCKRNILLVFCILLIIIILFFPCSEEAYFIPALEVVDVGVYINDEPVKQNDKQIPIDPIEKKLMAKIRYNFIVSYLTEYSSLKKFLDWKENRLKKLNEMAEKYPSYTISTEEMKFEEAFKKKYNNNFTFYRLKLSLILIELAIIILIACFSYILFCVVLRKEKKGER